MRFLLSLLAGSFFFSGLADAQSLIGIRIEPTEVTVGKPVQITINFTPSTVANGACGLVVNLGDGTTQQIRVENNSLPVTLSRTYSNVGAVPISAEGKLYVRGLNTVIGCFGKTQSVALTVRAEDPTEREAAELAAKEEAVKRATADRMAAEAAARSAATDRSATEAAAKKAKAERAAADDAAKKATTARIAAEKSAAGSAQPKQATTEPSVKRTDATGNQSSGTAARPAAPIPAPKSSQPKAKSSLDL